MNRHYDNAGFGRVYKNVVTPGNAVKRPTVSLKYLDESPRLRHNNILGHVGQAVKPDGLYKDTGKRSRYPKNWANDLALDLRIRLLVALQSEYDLQIATDKTGDRIRREVIKKTGSRRAVKA